MKKVQINNVAKYIIKYGMEINFSEDEEESEWSAFPCKTGGTWGYGDSLVEAVQDVIDNNEES